MGLNADPLVDFELILDPFFADPLNWFIGTNWTIDGLGTAKFAGVGFPDSFISQAIDWIDTRLYTVRMTIDAINYANPGHGVDIFAGNGNTPIYKTPGDKIHTFQMGTHIADFMTLRTSFVGGAPGDFATISHISIIDITSMLLAEYGLSTLENMKFEYTLLADDFVMVRIANRIDATNNLIKLDLKDL